MIQIEGLALERLLNAAFAREICIFEVKRISPTELTAKIRAADLSRLRALRRKYGCRIHILQKRGAALFFRRYKARTVLLFGWVPILIALFVLSRFIWFVEVEGCSRIGEDEITAMLSEMGVSPGVSAKELDHYAISRALSAQDERIAWAGASRRGVVLTVKIVEAEEIPETKGEELPGSIYARTDDVITEVTALMGRRVVAPGQTVKKGDLLITGELTSEAGIPHQVAARGKVMARVLYVIAEDAPKTAILPQRTGKSIPYCRITLFGRELFPPKGGYENFEFEAEHTAILQNILPLIVKSGELWVLSEQEVSLTWEEQQARALAAALERALALIPKDARIIGKQSEIMELQDGGIRVILSIETEEDIAEFGPLDVKNTETQDGA